MLSKLSFSFALLWTRTAVDSYLITNYLIGLVELNMIMTQNLPLIDKQWKHGEDNKWRRTGTGEESFNHLIKKSFELKYT